jgi:hypothetical protein
MCIQDGYIVEIFLLILGLIYTLIFILMTRNANKDHKSSWWLELLGGWIEFTVEKRSLNEKGRYLRILWLFIMVLIGIGVVYRSYCFN